MMDLLIFRDTEPMPLLDKFKEIWQNVTNWASNPWSLVVEKSKPWLKIVAVFFILFPIANFGISLYDDWQFADQIRDPNARPVTKEEFFILDKKIDTIWSAIAGIRKQEMAMAQLDQIIRSQQSTQQSYNQQRREMASAPMLRMETTNPNLLSDNALDDLNKQLKEVSEKADTDYRKKPK
jgi:hypothetical protein